MATLLPNVKLQFLDANGLPLAGGLLYSYAAGTTTPLATYTDQSEGTPNANPVVLDANGMATVWIGENSYKLKMTDSVGSVLWTVDNVASIFDGSVSTAKIADHAVTTVKMAVGVLSADAAGRALMALQYIQTGHIGDKQVTAGKIADATLGLTQMQDGIGFLPTGSLVPFLGTAIGTTCPVGFLTCDGASYLRTAYADLFSIIGTSCGAADATHFNVPDLRGRFVRGWDSGTGNDPDAAGRTAQATGGNTGNALGTYQADQVGTHNHSISLGTAGGNGAEPQGCNTVQATTSNTANGGGAESRPKNVAANYLIKT